MNKCTNSPITFLLLCFICNCSAEAQKPNFIVLLGDDISYNETGCYGSPNSLTTPHIDRLARDGVVFTNMFVTNAICAPVRAELYTGLQPYRNGVSTNRDGAVPGTKSVVHYMEALGYRVALTGKKHYKPASVFPFRYIEGFTSDCNLRGYQMEEDWPALEAFIAEEPEKPFCLFICSVHAHAPWDAGDSDLWDLKDIVLPPHFVDNKLTRHFYREHLAEVRLFDDQVGKAGQMVRKLGLEDNTVLMVLDENGTGMPGGKWTTYDWGCRSACIMKWPEKYHARFTTGAIARYCDILPTMIEAAGGKVPSELDGKSMWDLIRGKTHEHLEEAFFLYAQDREPHTWQSRAVFDGRYKLIWNITWKHDFYVGVINSFEQGQPQYTHRNMLDRHVGLMFASWVERAKTEEDAGKKVDRYRKHPEFELYDLSVDPWEQNNLAANEEMQDRIRKMKNRIIDWMVQQGDTAVLRMRGIQPSS